MAALKKSQHLKLPFEEIQIATKNFETRIGKGGYGPVYKGELFIRGKQTIVAVKRLHSEFGQDNQSGQGLKEFLTEIQLLFGQDHPNLISLLGYCDEGKEKIIVYEYAERGSLDKYLRLHGPAYNLTWVQRLKICVDAARGLDHLHNHFGMHEAIIHRDIKSANILLNENWVAKISDLGLSKLILSGLGRSEVVSHGCGTYGYCEPEYFQTGIVTKESDIYSFGMVLFEVLCGKLCNEKDDNGFKLTERSVKKYYEQKKLDEIVDPRIKGQMSSQSLNKFSTVAYQCLAYERERRPPIDDARKELEETLKIQMQYEDEENEYWKLKLPDDSEDIIQRLKPVGDYSTTKKLFMLLHKGFFFDNGERFFSIDDDGKKYEMISAKGFIKEKSKYPHQTPHSSQQHPRDVSMRSPMARQYPHIAELNIYCQISTSMLSLDTMYAVNLVFSFEERGDHGSLHIGSSRWVWIKWKCEELRESSAHFAKQREDGNFKTTLWHFINSGKNACFDIVINRLLGGEEEKLPYIIIHGLEFQTVEMIWPEFLFSLQKKAHNEIKGPKVVSLSNQEVDWKNKLPLDYQHIIDRSNTHLEHNTETELYFLLCDGILIDNGRKWFFLCKSTGEKCHMLPVIDIFCNDCNYELMNRLSLFESRFKEGIQLQNAPQYYFKCKLEPAMFSSGKRYTCYLVFNFSDGYTNPFLDGYTNPFSDGYTNPFSDGYTNPFLDGYTNPGDGYLLEVYCELDDKRMSTVFAHLNSREPVPFIKPKKKNTKLRDLWYIPKTKGSGVPKWCFAGTTHDWMQQRNDGWMEVILCEPFNELEKCSSMKVKLHSVKGTLNSIVVQGIEFRPMEIDV